MDDVDAMESSSAIESAADSLFSSSSLLASSPVVVAAAGAVWERTGCKKEKEGNGKQKRREYGREEGRGKQQ